MLALLNKEHRDRNVSQLFAIAMDFTGPSGAVTRPLSAFLRLAMMGCSALRARGELAVGACAPVLGWDRGGSSSAGARAWWGACGAGARGPLCGVF